MIFLETISAARFLDLPH